MNKLITSVIVLLVYVHTASGQKIIKLDLIEPIHSTVKSITENIYVKKNGYQKLLKTSGKVVIYTKPGSRNYSYTPPPVNLTIYSSDEEHLTTQPPKDTVNTVCIDAFNKDGDLLNTYWIKKTGDSVLHKDTIYKIQYQFKNLQKTGYIKINSDKKIEWRRIYTYNKQQLLSLVADYEDGTILNRKIKIDYLLFDSQGNWIKRKETSTLKNGTIAGITVVKRIITYY